MAKSFYKNLILEIPLPVYEPREDSHLLAEVLEKENLKGKNILDMGCGSGLLGIIASKAGAHVSAADIDAGAVECARKNAKACGAEIKLLVSDLFENLGKEKFDLIIFNAPYLPEKISSASRAWAAGEGNELISRFIREAKNFLSEKGKILLCISSLTGLENIMKKLSENGFGKGHVVPEEAIYFTKYENDVEIALQIVKPGSYKDKTTRVIISKLKQNPQLRKEFEELKIKLNGLPRSEYRKQKAAFIQRILAS